MTPVARVFLCYFVTLMTALTFPAQAFEVLALGFTAMTMVTALAASGHRIA